MKILAASNYLDKGFVELWDLSECGKSYNDFVNCVAKIATLSYGNDEAKNPENLVHKLDKLQHHSVFEFIRNPRFLATGCCNDDIQNSYRHKRYFTYDPVAYKNCVFTFKLKIPVFVARQLMRHRCASYLELSRRYTRETKKPLEFYNPFNDPEVDKLYNEAVRLYQKLSKKLKPEIARAVLPLSLYTEMFVQYNRECFKHFLKLRLDEHAQFEIRLLASIMRNLAEKQTGNTIEV